MSVRTCSIDDCPGDVIAKGWCWKHYQAHRRHGDPLANKVPPRRDPAERFWSFVIKHPDDGCWEWTGALSRGYGHFGQHGWQGGAYVWAWKQVNGPVPKGLHLDHLCHNRDVTCLGGLACLHRRCVRPSHLEAVPQLVNNQRMGARLVAHRAAAGAATPG